VSNFELATPDGQASPDVDCAKERIAVEEGDDAVDHHGNPECGDCPSSLIPPVLSGAAKGFEHDRESNDGGSGQPARVNGHTQSEPNHFSCRELVADGLSVHDLSSDKHANNDGVGADETNYRVCHEHNQPDSVQDQIDTP